MYTTKITLGNGAYGYLSLNAVINPITGKEMEYMALMKHHRLQPLWKRGFGNECGRLFQGIHNMFFITLANVPKDRNITYSKIVCD
jgi:hypothetical protein